MAAVAPLGCLSGLGMPAVWRWLLVVSSAFSLASGALAATMSMPNVRWNVAYQNRPLAEVLTEVLGPTGYSVQVSPQVNASVSGRLSGSLEKVFDTLVNTYGLIWYFERNIVYVYAAGEARSQMVRLERADAEAVMATLEQLKLNDRRFPLSYDARTRTLLTSGPPKWVDTVVAVAQSADEVQASPQLAVLKVFRLKHARATDRVVSTGSGESMLPGVVSLMQQMYGLQVTPTLSTQRQAPAAAAGAGAKESYAKLLKGLMSDGAKPKGGVEVGRMADGASHASPTLVLGTTEQGAARMSLPQIQADPRTNSVVIRDHADKMAMHEAAIQTLDMPTRLIEIEAAILDVNSDALESVGIDWRLSTRRLDVQVGDGSRGFIQRSNNLTQATGTSTPVGALATLAIGGGVNQLLARVSALEQSGRGKVVSKPKIVTPENMEATIENTSTYYVKLQGNLEVNLANVTTGTALRVFPSIQEGRNGTQVKLAIRIDDGNITPATVDNLPVVNRNSVTTEAVVAVGQTLLIGGLSVERETNTDSGVPVLRSLPVVGKLFESKDVRRERVERIFMLTPRVIDVDG